MNESLSIRRKTGDRRDQADSLNNIGTIYLYLGQAITLRNIGLLYKSLGDLPKGMEALNKSLPISRAIGDRYGEALALHNIGMVYNLLGEQQIALDRFAEALKISRIVKNRELEGAALTNIAHVYRSLGEFGKALNYYNEALPINQAIGTRNVYVANLLGISQMELKGGNLSRARQLNERAIGIVESQRGTIGSEDLRASYLASQQDCYQLYIDILMQSHKANPSNGYDAAALAVSERARARSLLELLTEARADIRKDVDASLLAGERALSMEGHRTDSCSFMRSSICGCQQN
ncbi:MAG: tetratricopeptide repeat protein [Blastocatellia bacterium]|nr:tetratricopeptide repeat protein [Blastocatellia bacterium]